MKIIVTQDYERMSDCAFEIMKDVVKRYPAGVLGLATGTTPLGLYARMAEDHRKCGTSYAEIRTVNLDEYAGLGTESDQSYVSFMRQNLFRYLDIRTENTHIADGKAADLRAECARYGALVASMQQDIQLLGIGSNGHIAFNEPGTPFGSTVHVVDLAESTVRDNSRLFARMEDVPRQALTMGLKDIMHAKRILILANGAGKAKAVAGMVCGPVTESLPASVLQLHPDCTLVCDRAAASLLEGGAA